MCSSQSRPVSLEEGLEEEVPSDIGCLGACRCHAQTYFFEAIGPNRFFLSGSGVR